MRKLSKAAGFCFNKLFVVIALSIAYSCAAMNLYAQDFDLQDLDLSEEKKIFLGKILKEESLSSKNLLYSAYIAYKDKSYDLSILLFENFSQKNPYNMLAKGISDYYTGKNYSNLGNHNNAIDKYKSVEALDLKEYNYLKLAAMVNSAASYYQLKNYDQFEKILKKVIEEDRDIYGDYARMMLAVYNLKKIPKEISKEAPAPKDEKLAKPEEPKKDEQKSKEEAIATRFGIGVEGGRNFIKSTYASEFANQFYIKPYFLFYQSRFFYLTVNMEYFKTEASEKAGVKNPVFTMLGQTLEINLYDSFLKYLKIAISPGAGLARTTTTKYSPAYSFDQSIDPYFVTSVSIGVYSQYVSVKTGVSYKRVFIYNNAENKYLHKDLVLNAFFLTIGLNF